MLEVRRHLNLIEHVGIILSLPNLAQRGIQSHLGFEQKYPQNFLNDHGYPVPLHS